jgi:hypothetical protein
MQPQSPIPVNSDTYSTTTALSNAVACLNKGDVMIRDSPRYVKNIKGIPVLY